MSSKGIYKLFTNSGLQDKMLMATDYLNHRVSCIIAQNNIRSKGVVDAESKYNPANSWTPMLDQIERTHNIYVNGSFKPFVAMGYEYRKTSCSEGTAQLGNKISFKIEQYGDFFNDMVVHIRLTGLKAKNPGDKVRYASFLGHKLIKKANIQIQNNLIDDYTDNEYNAFYNFHVPSGKKNGWLRNMGQEIPTLGYVTSNPATDETREYRWFGDGNQTFKREHSVVDLWIPMLFWYQNTKHAVPSFILPYGQNKLELTLAPENELIAFANYASGLTVGKDVYDVPKIAVCELYTNYIFMDTAVHDIFAKHFGFSLIRVHKRQLAILNSSSNSYKLNELKWPIETMYIAFRPSANKELSQYWHKNSVLTQTDISVPVSNATTVSINQVHLQKESPSISTLGLSAYGISIFEDTLASFYSGYMPYRWGKSVNSPEDAGWFMMNFNLKPGENDPSGHINVSRAREFYLEYTSDYISRTNEVELIVLADALNFFLIKDGTGVLRFTT
jgi:hypothetical protein